ncbi:SDR family NAD(P)-dependent oxidoreductase, partial [Umezawaea sp.]|uniref:SDR family NAD(P)-dependent oxidoreductase n=1 Tax=Umezawaea sp. TaxID=1955258 RepID=UPI002ED64C5C
MEPVVEDFRAVVEGLSFTDPTIPIVSTVTGAPATAAELCSPEYWVRHVRRPVRFLDAVTTLAGLGVARVLELGPDGVLTAMVADSGIDPSVAVPLLRKGKPEERTLLAALAALHVDGVPVEWDFTGGRRVDLPTYPFARERFWLRNASEGSGVDLDAPVVLAGDDGVLLTGAVSLAGSGVPLELAWRAADEVGCDVITELVVERPLVVPARVQVRVDADRVLTISSHVGGTWVRNATGSLGRGPATEAEHEWLPPVEVALPDDVGVEGFRLHPGLLEGFEVLAWRGVRLFATGATRLAVSRSASGALVARDHGGAVVLSAESVELGVLDAPADALDSMYRVEWSEIAVTGTDPGSTVLEAGALHDVLDAVRSWLADDRPDGERLVVVTRGAVAVRDDEDVTDPALAPVWGLLRSAQAEHPGRFVLADLDDDPASTAVLPSALAADEPQLAVRAGSVFVPRLARVAATATRPVLDPDGTVLVTGATGGLGRLLARHLVADLGVRHLLLTGRRGEEAAGMPELRDELTGLGAAVTVAACDVADRDQVADLLRRVPAEHPLTVVVHAAGINDDSVVSTLTRDRLDRVLRPKVDAALALHELTRDLAAFVLFSSASATFGGPGQANYAAGNAFLDALAHHRVARGLPAVSLAWGLWAERDGMGGRLSEVDLTRMARAGMGALSEEEGLALFDAALGSSAATLVPARLDLAAFSAGPVPALLRGLVATPSRRAVTARTAGEEETSLAGRLAGLARAEQERVLLTLVRTHVADVLGHGSPQAIEPDRGFLELGLDSLTAVELRNRLGAETGLRLPTTLVFDHPTPVAVAAHLGGELLVDAGTSALAELDRIEEGLADVGEDARVRLVDRLEALLAAVRGDAEPGGLDLDGASLDEVFDFIDEEFRLQ